MGAGLVPSPAGGFSRRALSGERHFTDGCGFYMLFWVFTFGSLFGFFVETIWAFCRYGELLVRSSMVVGPFNFIYGAGAVAFFLTVRLTGNRGAPHIMLAGMIAGTLIEQACSVLQELAFGTVSWDYSSMPLNIGGRVCLLYAVFWGLLALIWAKALQTPIERLILRIPNNLGRRLTWVTLFFFITFSAVSIAAVLRWSGRLDGMPATGSVTSLIDRVFDDGYMETVYNNMIFLSRQH